MPRPTDDTITRLRELYRERERLNRLLDRVLSKLSTLLLEQEDYRQWRDNLEDKLPEWIHEVTGGRPLYHSQKPVVQRTASRRKDEVPVEEKDDYVESIFLKAREAFKKGGTESG